MITQKPKWDVRAVLDTAGLSATTEEYPRGEAVYTQGDPADDVLYILDGGVKLSVVSTEGKEAVVAMLGPGEFFGEGALAGQPIRNGSATAITVSHVLAIPKVAMVTLLHQRQDLSDRFIAHMLLRNVGLETDLIDQLFNSNEKRLARALLLLAGYGTPDPKASVPPISEQALSELAGTTLQHVTLFMKKFNRLGFIDSHRPSGSGITINSSLLGVVLRD